VLLGTRPNRDVELTPPDFGDVARLIHRGDVFELRIRARAAYAEEVVDERSVAWRDSARRHLPVLCEQLPARLTRSLSSRAADWGLSAYDPSAPEYTAQQGRLSSSELMRIDGIPIAPTTGPLRVRYEVPSERIEPQSITVAFASVPSAARVLEIEHELARTLAGLPL
jgi:hypothetical protein